MNKIYPLLYFMGQFIALTDVIPRNFADGGENIENLTGEKSFYRISKKLKSYRFREDYR